MHRIKLSISLLLIALLSVNAQRPKKPNSSEILESIQKLNVLASVLYVAAHPDDENTRLISYMSNEVKARTAYLSLTRGDGGQNLIGSEIRELLGIMIVALLFLVTSTIKKMRLQNLKMMSGLIIC